jgi:tetratricopeptide (TPR) repeat protein
VVRHSLENVRTDGWLEKLGEGSPTFRQLCQVMGERFVGFSVIAGLRITSLAHDARHPERSVVELDLGDGGRRARLALSELQDKLADAMIEGPTPAAPLPGRPSDEDLQAAVGYRWVLLAALFDLRLEALEGDGDDARIWFSFDGEESALPLEDFRDRIREAVRTELARVSERRSGSRVGGPFSIDLALVERARTHADAEDHAEVVSLLGGWPGPLSVLLRTAEASQLGAEARAQIALGLGMLGSAHVRLGRFDWGIEVMRLGIQWAQDNDASRDLFVRLGHAYLEADRAGEAIGLLRRARELGANDELVAPALARAFVARGRHLAAIAWVVRATRQGVTDPSLAKVAAEARAALVAENAALEGALADTGWLRS